MAVQSFGGYRILGGGGTFLSGGYLFLGGPELQTTLEYDNDTIAIAVTIKDDHNDDDNRNHNLKSNKSRILKSRILK